jgi:hypothetical protein
VRASPCGRKMARCQAASTTRTPRRRRTGRPANTPPNTPPGTSITTASGKLGMIETRCWPSLLAGRPELPLAATTECACDATELANRRAKRDNQLAASVRGIDLSAAGNSGITGALTLSSTAVRRRLRWGSGRSPGGSQPGALPPELSKVDSTAVRSASPSTAGGDHYEGQFEGQNGAVACARVSQSQFV